MDNANLTADTVGAITAIENIRTGGFSQSAIDDLSHPGRNLLVFIHGFDNSFENAITRAAFNQQWFADSHLAGADCAMVAFSWPSIGKLISPPLPWSDYFHDQTKAGQSGAHIMSFFANLLPIITAARASGVRVNLLTHSMGNWALQGAVESWFSHGQGAAALFDHAILAAADEIFNSFAYPAPGRLSQLRDLAAKISIYYSRNDAVLDVSRLVNLGAQRLGQQGQQNPTDATLFPPSIYRTLDCSDVNDYAYDFASSHQYYRRSPSVRTDIAGVL
ncbi:MAG: alpha/beta fold hydrolase [Rhodospirillales bacterium]